VTIYNHNDIQISEKLVLLLESIGDKERLALARLITHRLRNPESYVTVIGEVSTGKSSLINSLFQQHLLPVSAKTTTAAVTHVACLDVEDKMYYAIYKDATQEKIDKEVFNTLCVEPQKEKDLLRLQVRAKPVDASFLGLQMFDTPGYDSLLAEHEEVLRSFLPQSDVVIFVTAYSSGFGQADQDLLELVSSSIEYADEIPIILVVNRTPSSVDKNDKRIREILSNAEDSLHYIPRLVVVPHVMSDAIPDARELWEEVAAIVKNPELHIFVRMKLISMLKELVDDADAEAEREEIVLSAKPEELKTIQKQINDLKDTRDESLKEIEITIKHLGKRLPELVNYLVEGIHKKLAKEIDRSDKWFEVGGCGCAQWLAIHVIPFEVREAAKSIEEMIIQEMEKLNETLNDLANTAIKKVQDRVIVKGDATARFAENITKYALRRGGGYIVNNLLQGIGGVGGAAAGAGNIVKMTVSRIGKVFGKTFSRQVYAKIGSVFTKQCLKRLNAALQVVIEAITYLYQVKTWQGKLKKKVREAIDKWKDGDDKEIGVIDDLLKKHLPAIKKNNESDVNLFYDDLINNECVNYDKKLSDIKDDLALVQKRRVELNRIRQQIESLLRN